MGKKKEIDGKEFGEKLLDPQYKTNFTKGHDDRKPIIKFKSALNNLRINLEFKGQWELLWKWRDIPKENESEKITFFKVQSLLRNPQAQKKRNEFIKKNDMQGFYKYAGDNWYIHPADLIGYSKGYRFPTGINIKEIFKDQSLDDIFSIKGLSDADRKELSSEMKVVARWVVPASQPPTNHSDAVTEVFSEENYMGNYAELKSCFGLEDVFAYSNWESDLSQIAIDRHERIPVTYLRIPHKYYNVGNVEYKIRKLIKDKIKEMRCKVQSVGNCPVWELALMIYDLHGVKGFNDRIIYDLIFEITKEGIDVQEKKKQANRLIKTSILPLKDFTSTK